MSELFPDVAAAAMNAELQRRLIEAAALARSTAEKLAEVVVFSCEVEESERASELLLRQTQVLGAVEEFLTAPHSRGGQRRIPPT